MVVTLHILALICIVILTATSTSLIKDINADPKCKQRVKKKIHGIKCKIINGAIPTVASIVFGVVFAWALLFGF